MGESVQLRSDDGQELSAYVARAGGEPIAGLVVIQEIFGVNAHIRSVADGYAKDGFLTVAPAIFDRIEPGLELSYEQGDMQKGFAIAQKLEHQKMMLDIAAALKFAATATVKKVGVIGYCFGGTVAWLAAAHVNPSAVVGYYGGRIGQYSAEKPTCPVMLHFGNQDTHIPVADVEKVQAAHPEVEIYWYVAGHAFNCEPRPSYNPAAAKLARERSLAFLKKHLT
jgi:carboxymethylenebutenolidase